MFCIKCGFKIVDNAVFCINCGERVRYDNTENMPNVKAQSEQIQAPVNTVPNMMPSGAALQGEAHIETEMPKAEMPKVELSKAGMPKAEIPQAMPVNTVPANTAALGARQPEYQNNIYGGYDIGEAVSTKSNIMAFSVLSVIFALLTIASAVFEMLDSRSGIQDISRLSEVIITSIILCIFAFTKNRTVSLMKGIAMSVMMVADIVFIGFDCVKYAFTNIFDENMINLLSSFKRQDKWVIMAYFIGIAAMFLGMYIFIIADTIRAFTGTAKFKVIPLIFGFIGIIGAGFTIALKYIIDGETILYSGFLPLNLIYIFFIFAVMFGIMSKRKKLPE